MNNNGGDIFLVKYSPSGTVLWARNTGSGYFSYIYSIASDAIGNIYLTGYFFGSTIICGSFILNNVSSSSVFDDVVIIKFNSSGTVVNAKSFGSANSDM